MRALIMAAGLGTRLRPLTDHCPKPLVPLCGRPMVEFVLELLEKQGMREAMINIHYLPQQMRDFVQRWNEQGRAPHLVIQDESREILGSGGAVALASSWLFEEESVALICNADVIATPDLHAFLCEHQALRKKHGVECTLAVMSHAEAGKRYTGLRVENHFVQEFVPAGKGNRALFHFPGFYFLEKKAVARLPESGEAFSILETLWSPLLKEKKLGAWLYEGEFLDLGTPEDLQAAEKKISNASSMG